MPTTTLLQQVKLALRVNHNLLDSEYERLIDTAKTEMARVGISSTVIATGTDKLVVNAIITYIKADIATSEAEREGYFESFKYQIDNMRRSSDYV